MVDISLSLDASRVAVISSITAGRTYNVLAVDEVSIGHTSCISSDWCNSDNDSSDKFFHDALLVNGQMTIAKY
jgi:hypothetical protein